MGFTDQIAIHPPASDLRRGDFLWRLSSARIEKASPFSTFPEHDRVLIILEGSGVRIVHQFSPGEVEITDVLPLEPYEFPGDVPTDCVLLGARFVCGFSGLRGAIFRNSPKRFSTCRFDDAPWF